MRPTALTALIPPILSLTPLLGGGSPAWAQGGASLPSSSQVEAARARLLEELCEREADLAAAALLLEEAFSVVERAKLRRHLREQDERGDPLVGSFAGARRELVVRRRADGTYRVHRLEHDFRGRLVADLAGVGVLREPLSPYSRLRELEVHYEGVYEGRIRYRSRRDELEQAPLQLRASYQFHLDQAQVFERFSAAPTAQAHHAELRRVRQGPSVAMQLRQAWLRERTRVPELALRVERALDARLEGLSAEAQLERLRALRGCVAQSVSEHASRRRPQLGIRQRVE